MSMFHILLLILAPISCFSAQEITTTRSYSGENWKIISRGSISSGAIGYTITNPGNYMLSESITPTAGSATALIQINTDDVVLDLGGHTLNGTNVTGKGILISGRKNITICNGHLDSIQGISLHITAESSNVRIDTMTFTSPGSTADIQLDSNSTKLSNITIIGNGSLGNSINFSNTLNDIILENIRISNIAAKAISIGTSSYNIRLKNIEIDTCSGTNNGITIGTTCYDILCDGIRLSNTSSDGFVIGNSCYGIIVKNGSITNCAGLGMNIGSDTHGILLSNLVITGCQNGMTAAGMNGSVIDNCSVSRSIGTSAYGCKLVASQNILIQKSNFFETISAGNPVAGVWLVNCSNIQCTNVQSSGHSGSQAYGFKLETNCFGCNFENCVTRGNFATSITATQGALGFYLSASKGCTFTQCVSTSHQGAAFAAGYYQTGCSSNSYTDCKSLQNSLATGSATGIAAGFYSVTSNSNRWQGCEANGQNAGNIASTAGYGAMGYYLSTESQSSLFRCKALGNGSFTAHAATTAGFYLDATVNPACKCLEIRECASNSNCTSGTTGTTAYGFWDTSVGTSNVFIDCYAASNSDSATPRIVTNYAANLPIGGTTPSNFPRVEANLDGLLDVANKPPFYNVSITS